MAVARKDLLSRPYDLVILTNYNNEQDPQRYEDAWSDVLAAGNRLAVVADNPETTQDAIACLTRSQFGANEEACGIARSHALKSRDSLVVAADRTPGAIVVDLTRYYCNPDWCPSVVGNVIVYRDTNHITATFAKTLSKPLEQAIRDAIQKPLDTQQPPVTAR
jgi:hypothetical protein